MIRNCWIDLMMQMQENNQGVEKMNDLSQLLSPQMDNSLTHDLSVVTLH